MSIHTLRKQIEGLQRATQTVEYILQVWSQVAFNCNQWKGSFRPGDESEGIYTEEEIIAGNKQLERSGYRIPSPFFIEITNIGTID